MHRRRWTKPIYRYDREFWHHEEVEAKFRHMGFAAKGLTTPLPAENKIIDTQGPAYLSLIEFVAARGALPSTPKRKV